MEHDPHIKTRRRTRFRRRERARWTERGVGRRTRIAVKGEGSESDQFTTPGEEGVR